MSMCICENFWMIVQYFEVYEQASLHRYPGFGLCKHDLVPFVRTCEDHQTRPMMCIFHLLHGVQVYLLNTQGGLHGFLRIG